MNQPKQNDLKKFALIWSLIFFIVAIWPLLFSDSSIRVWAVVIMFIFGIIAFLKPLILTPLYIIWVKFGEVIGGVISKVIMAILFYGMFTPIAFILKFLNKDLLKKKLDRDSSSYWIKRDTQPGSLKNQF